MPIRILIADDNPDDTALLQHALRGEVADLTIHVVSDGNLALGELRDYPGIDLVILDNFLPRKTAGEILEHLGKGRLKQGCPVVVLTSHVPQALRDVLVSAGATEVIQKPADWDGFQELARQLLSMLRTPNPLEARK